MQSAVVTSTKCTAHERCPARKVCPTKAITQLDPGEVAVINPSLCLGCGDCVPACPDGAINIRQT